MIIITYNMKNVIFQAWSNAIHFWFDVQKYKHLFYAEIFDRFTVERKSQVGKNNLVLVN